MRDNNNNKPDNKTGEQLLAYIERIKMGEVYSGPLSSEAQDLIDICGNDLNRLARHAQALHFLDHTFGG